MKALSNSQLTRSGWYYFEPTVNAVGNRSRFVHIEDDCLDELKNGWPKSSRGSYYGPVSIFDLKDEHKTTGLTEWVEPTQAQRAVMIYQDTATGEYSCYPALGELPREPSVEAVDGPTWIASTLNRLRKALPKALA